MGLRCLLGHDFTEPRTEREREERGDEVIIAVRRVKECRRCGETQVVSENKEVTSMSQPLGEPGADDGSGDAAGAAGDAGRSDGAERTDASDAARAGGPRTGDDADSLIANAEEGEAFDHPEADVDAVDTDVEDDAEIIRSGPSDAQGAADDAGERGRGEWPDADVNRSTGAVGRDTGVDGGTWTTGDEDGSSTDAGPPAAEEGPTDPADEDAEFIDADAAGGAGDADAGTDAAGTGDDRVPWPNHDGDDEGFDAAFGGEEAPADPTDSADDTADGADAAADDAGGEYIEAASEPLDDAASDADSRWSAPSGSSRSGSDADAEGGAAEDGATGAPAASGIELKTASGDPDAEYVCPECGAREPVGASSTRAGDICPDCKRGYIEERELE